MLENNHFSAIKIRLASPEQIRQWSHGEVKKPETINYRTLKPDEEGLFCEVIFGPQKDYECRCGKYKKTAYSGKPKHTVCDKCHVEVTKSSVRREYMGHIELAAPVVHIWYLKGTPCYLKMLLNISPKDLENVIYYARYVVLDPGDSDLQYKDILDQKAWDSKLAECKALSAELPEFKMPRVGMGAEAILELLQAIDLPTLEKELRDEANSTTGQKHTNAVKRLEIVKAFIESQNKPEWIVLRALPVSPPDLRPMVQLDGGRFATSDLNDLYRKVITRNNRLQKSMEIKAPSIIIRCEKRILQEAVDSLIDNGRRDKKPLTGPGNRPLKSLTSMLKGKQGRFRQNLLGKRVDYSGRSVIVVGPELKMYQCGLPKEMALELFRPFVMKKLQDDNPNDNVKTIKARIEHPDERVWAVLEEVIKDHPVLLNRAPTLHRLGIQAFEPILVEGRAIKLHPLVCTAYNADFDGDQMAVHVPLSVEAQAEARFLMLASNNILKPQDGKPVVVPTQDMILGCYYLTLVRPNPKREPGYIPAFYSEEEAIYAYQTGNVTLQEPIKVRISSKNPDIKGKKVIDATVGKIIINQKIPQDLGFVDRTNPENAYKLEIDFKVKKGELKKIVDFCYRRHGATETSRVLDDIKAMGFQYSTRAGITVGYKDIQVPEEKKQHIADAENKVAQIEMQYKMGFISAETRKSMIVEVWKATNEIVSKLAIDSFGEFNPIHMMADSGARGNNNQISQLAGMKGLVNDTAGGVIEVPVKSNFREGLTILEFFVSSHGARKGLADTALRTADSGYLTRRLVDVSQDVIVRDNDCFATAGKPIAGIDIESIVEVSEDAKDDDADSKKKVIVDIGDRILGRYTAAPVIHPVTGEMILDINERITMDKRDEIVKAGIEKVRCRSVFTCQCEHGVCRKCYGDNLATGNEVDVGEAVGIIAAQAIGEPGTQLTMRTFHTGGVASASDITTGLPRVEEIFEARKPKGVAVLTEIDGVVSIKTEGKKRDVTVTPRTGDGEVAKTYSIPVGSVLRVSEGDTVTAGEPLTKGAINPNEILNICGRTEAQQYLLREVHKVYSSQGVELSDKHIEIIIRQMMRKVQIEDAGDTKLLPGSLVEKFRFEKENLAVIQENMQIKQEGEEKGLSQEEIKAMYKMPAKASPKMLGITKAALATDSFLSAASFQETTRILTDAAIKGKIDPLTGLKENIIIGKLIPAGIGMKRYNNIDVKTVVDAGEDSEPIESEQLHAESASGETDGYEYDEMFDDVDVSEADFDDSTDTDN